MKERLSSEVLGLVIDRTHRHGILQAMRKVFLPHTLEEFWQVLGQYPQATVYAGCTDLLVKLRSNRQSRPILYV